MTPMADQSLPVNPTFGQRLEGVIAERGRLCVGIDPHRYLLERWGLPVSAVGALELGLRVLDEVKDRVGIVKPQVAFYERFGANGYRVLEELFEAAREQGFLVIADVKRGDVGTTLEAYADAWLDPASPLAADAMTLNPFQGFDTLRHPLEMAARLGKGLFVLAATSNPESASIQTARRVRGSQEGKTVAGGIAARAANWNREHGNGGIGSVGVVLGGTVDFDFLGIDLDDLATGVRTPVLAPGFGHQGADLTRLADIYGPASPATVVTASRSLLDQGQDGLGRLLDTHLQLLTEAEPGVTP